VDIVLLADFSDFGSNNFRLHFNQYIEGDATYIMSNVRPEELFVCEALEDKSWFWLAATAKLVSLEEVVKEIGGENVTVVQQSQNTIYGLFLAHWEGYEALSED